MFDKIKKKLLEAIREDMNYRMPSHYISWQVLSQVVVIGLATCGLDYAKVDISAFYQSYRIALWFAQKAPMYCLTHELIEAFDQTDAIRKPGIMCGWQPSLPTFLLAIPKGVISTPDGANIDYLTISCSNIDHPEWNLDKWKGLSIKPFKLTYPLYFQCTIAILNDFLCISVLINFGPIKFMFLSKELKQKFDNLKIPT